MGKEAAREAVLGLMHLSRKDMALGVLEDIVRKGIGISAFSTRLTQRSLSKAVKDKVV